MTPKFGLFVDFNVVEDGTLAGRMCDVMYFEANEQRLNPGNVSVMLYEAIRYEGVNHPRPKRGDAVLLFDGGEDWAVGRVVRVTSGTITVDLDPGEAPGWSLQLDYDLAEPRNPTANGWRPRAENVMPDNRAA